MPDSIKELNEKNFEGFIAEGNAIIDFWAEWCGPCKVLKPIFGEVARELKGKIKFGMVNIEDGQEIAERFDVMSVPTVIFFKEGEMVERFSGVMQKGEIIKLAKDIF